MSKKPSCYGDPDLHEDDDVRCQRCMYFTSCGFAAAQERRIGVREEPRREEPRRDRNYPQRDAPHSRRIPPTNRRQDVSKQATDKPVPQIIEDDDDTYLSVLTHNAAIEAVQSMAEEFVNSVRSVPRKSYKNLWTKRDKK